MKSNKKAKGGFAIIAFSVMAILILLGGIGYVLTKDANGVYKTAINGDLRIKALDVYQYIDSIDDVDDANNIILQIENINEDRDYNLKIVYEAWGQNETLNVEVLGGNTELVKVPDLFSASDINSIDVHSKVLEVKNGDEVVASFDYKLNVGKVTVDRTNAKVRVPELIIAETTSDSMLLWYDIEDNLTLADITAIESNNSLITITNIDHEIGNLVDNSWVKIILNYDVKGSVFEDEYLEDGFGVNLEVSYDGINTTNSFEVVEDIVKTSSLTDLASLQAISYEEISSVN
jgi:hypothetical protein